MVFSDLITIEYKYLFYMSGKLSFPMVLFGQFGSHIHQFANEVRPGRKGSLSEGSLFIGWMLVFLWKRSGKITLVTHSKTK